MSILDPAMYEVILMASVGCSVGGDKKLLMEKLKDVETGVLNRLEAVTLTWVRSPMHWKVDLTFYIYILCYC